MGSESDGDRYLIAAVVEAGSAEIVSRHRSQRSSRLYALVVLDGVEGVSSPLGIQRDVVIGHYGGIVRLGVSRRQVPTEEGITAPRCDVVVDVHSSAVYDRDRIHAAAAVGDENKIEAVDFPERVKYCLLAFVEIADACTRFVGIHDAVLVRPTAEDVAAPCFGYGKRKGGAEGDWLHFACFDRRTAVGDGIVAGEVQDAFADACLAVTAESYGVFFACGDVVFEQEVAAVGAVVVGGKQVAGMVIQVTERVDATRRRHADIARHQRDKVVIMQCGTVDGYRHRAVDSYGRIADCDPLGKQRQVGAYLGGEVVGIAGTIFGLIPTAEQITASYGNFGIRQRDGCGNLLRSDASVPAVQVKRYGIVRRFLAVQPHVVGIDGIFCI